LQFLDRQRIRRSAPPAHSRKWKRGALLDKYPFRILASLLGPQINGCRTQHEVYEGMFFKQTMRGGKLIKYSINFFTQMRCYFRPHIDLSDLLAILKVLLTKEINMKPFSLLIATLAIPGSLAFAQTTGTTGTTGTASQSSIPFIPLIGSANAGTGGTSNSTAWFVDVAKNQVVLCSQSAAATTGGTTSQSFTCTAQPIPAATSATASGATPSGG
jgi:hypothetical protein